MKRIIELDGRSIEYDLERKNVKNLNLRIKADQSVYVSANRKVSEKTIQDFLQSKSDYILKALDHYAEMAKYAPKPKVYVDGESFTILGHELRLKVMQGKRNFAVSDEVYVTLSVKDPNDHDMKKRTMDNWIILKKFVNPSIRNFKSMALSFRCCGSETWFHVGAVVSQNERSLHSTLLW